MQTSEQVAGEAREKLAAEALARIANEIEQNLREHPNRPMKRMLLTDEVWSAVAVALRAQPERGAEETERVPPRVYARIGISTHPADGGRGETGWQLADGTIKMFPTGFDPNTGETGPTIMFKGQTIYLQVGERFIPAGGTALPLHPAKDEGEGR